MLTRALALLLLLAPSARAYKREEHYATLRLILAGAVAPVDAGLIATCAQLPDEAPEMSAIDIYRRLMRHPFDYTSWIVVKKGPIATVGRMLTMQQLLHGITGGSSEAMQETSRELILDLLPALSMKPAPERADALCALGFAFHLHADSFSHQMLKNPDKMYETGLGHFFDSAKPDFPLYSRARAGAWHEYVLTTAGLLPRADHAALKQMLAEADELEPGTAASNGFRQAALLAALNARLHAAGVKHAAFDRSLAGRGCQALLDHQAAVDAFGPAPDCERTWTLYRDAAIRRFNAAETATATRVLRGVPFKKLEYFMDSPFSEKKK